MKKQLLWLLVLLAVQSDSKLSASLEKSKSKQSPVIDKLKTNIPIKIQTGDGEVFSVPYGDALHSYVIRTLTQTQILDENKNLGKDPIELSMISGEGWKAVHELIKDYGNLAKNLEKKDVSELAAIIAVVDYLDIPNILNTSIDIIADKIKNSKHYYYNKQTEGKIKDKNLFNKVKPITLSMPYQVEKIIIAKLYDSNNTVISEYHDIIKKKKKKFTLVFPNT